MPLLELELRELESDRRLPMTPRSSFDIATVGDHRRSRDDGRAAGCPQAGRTMNVR